VEAVLAKLVDLCSLLVNWVCADVLWDLRHHMSDKVLVLVACHTYRRVECRVEESNVGCRGQLFVNSFDDGQGTCVMAMLVSYG
jgi:hypothetical protein